jgi:hypothetical protein
MSPMAIVSPIYGVDPARMDKETLARLTRGLERPTKVTRVRHRQDLVAD